MRISRSKSRRRRVGRVTVYQRGRHFWVYYRQGGEAIRRVVGTDRGEAMSLAAPTNAELAGGAPTTLAFRSVDVASLTAQGGRTIWRPEQLWGARVGAAKDRFRA
jgi:hypothetical protein